MPRICFDTSPGGTLPELPDKEGEELGPERRPHDAVRLSGEILWDYPDRFWSTGEWRCTVPDEDRLTLLVLHLIATGAPAAVAGTDGPGG